MDVGDIVSRAYLKEQGFVELWGKNVGKLDEVFVYHHKEKSLDVKIERYYNMPDVYTVMLKLDVKALKQDIEQR